MSTPGRLITLPDRTDGWAIAMFTLHPHLTSLPQNAEVHLRLRWQRGLLGLPMLAPAVVVQPRRSRR